VLAQDLRDVMVPEPSEEEVMVALAADLASGSLNGRDSGGSLIQIGSSSNFLSECPDSDLIDASAQLGDELSGLRNLLLQAIGGGTLTAAAPGDWNTFFTGIPPIGSGGFWASRDGLYCGVAIGCS
jgi:hypothetical protein